MVSLCDPASRPSGGGEQRANVTGRRRWKRANAVGKRAGGNQRDGGAAAAVRTGAVFAQCALTVSAILPDAKTSAQNFATHQFDLLHYAIFAFRSVAVLRVCVAACVCVNVSAFFTRLQNCNFFFFLI